MPEKCFYCTDEIEERKIHYVSFFTSNTEKDEPLCDECYREWLHGVKGQFLKSPVIKTAICSFINKEWANSKLECRVIVHKEKTAAYFLYSGFINFADQ